jgi:hypothetical protein
MTSQPSDDTTDTSTRQYWRTRTVLDVVKLAVWIVHEVIWDVVHHR